MFTKRKKSLTDIQASFTSTINELDSLAERNAFEVAENLEQIERLEGRNDHLCSEINTAKHTASRLRSLIG